MITILGFNLIWVDGFWRFTDQGSLFIFKVKKTFTLYRTIIIYKDIYYCIFTKRLTTITR